MGRRNFIRLTGLTTFGLIAGRNLFASVFKEVNYELIEIKPPKIHVRHGLFNIHSTTNNRLHIQRDIFNGNGLEQISEERMVSIKISDINGETFGISNKKEFKSKSSKLTAMKLSKHQSSMISIDSPSIIFSEFDGLHIDGINIKNDQAFLQNHSVEMKISSEANQFVFVYKINNERSLG